MSWSVSAKGKIADVKSGLDGQFQAPLAEKPGGLTDDGERETVQRVRDTIFRCLDTFDPEKIVMVIAHGHMAFDAWDTKTGPEQTVFVSIQPTS